MPIKKGSTNRSVDLHIIDATNGTNEDGVTYATAGLALWYCREGGTKQEITAVTKASHDAAHVDGGFLFISDGDYRLDVPDAAWATGSSRVRIGGIVTGMIIIPVEIELVNYDVDDLESRLTTTRAGYLDNLAELTTARMGALTDWIDGGRLDLILDAINTAAARLTLARGNALDLIGPMDVALAALPSATDIEDALLDALLADHAGAGTVGAGIAAAGAAGDPWSTALPGAYAAGTAGAIIGAFLALSRTPLVPGAYPSDARDICTRALRAIGDATILTDDMFTAPAGKQEQACALFYDDARRETLQSSDWTCLAKRVRLSGDEWAASRSYAEDAYLYADGNVYRATTGGTSGAAAPTWPDTSTVADGSVVWTFQYAVLAAPSADNFTKYAYAFPVPEDYIRQINVTTESGEDVAFAYERQTLYTDEEFPVLVYVPDSNDVTLWDPKLIDTVVIRLAAKLTLSIPGDGQKYAMLEQKAAQVQPDAIRKSRREARGGPQKPAPWGTE